MDGNKNTGTPLAQSIVANIQLDLPGTVSRLSAKMRFIDKIAPVFKKAGVVKDVALINPLNINAAGIGTSYRTANAFGGILYIAGAVRQDIIIEKGSIYQTRQESAVDLDEVDDLSIDKRLKYINIINTYKLLNELMEGTGRPDIILLDIPLMLELADVPAHDSILISKTYDKCIHIINAFWKKYKDQVYPFNTKGIKLASIGNKRFGAIVLALERDKKQYIADSLDSNHIDELLSAETMDKMKKVGIKRLLQGILVKSTRTAAFQFDAIIDRNRLNPRELRETGLMGFHIKAGYNTPPLLVEIMGSVNDWKPEMLDELASEILSLIVFDQKKSVPLPLWYAKYALRPIEARPGVLEYFKSQSREMLKNEELESIWKSDFDAFEEPWRDK